MTARVPRGPIAIDGPAASGKTSVGRAIARQCGFGFLDTGLMYRAFTLAAIRSGIAPENEEACALLAGDLPMRVEASDDTRVFLGEEDVTPLLRSPEVEGQVSAYSAIAGVRAAMVEQQRAIAQAGNVVLAGRDIGTVVLPDAPLKLFLTASEDERARRRSLQASEWGEDVSAEASQAAIGGRDRIDSSRAASPLRPARDAVTIDTTGKSLEDVVAEALGLLDREASESGSEPPLAGSRDGKAGQPRPRIPGRRGQKYWVPVFYWSTQMLITTLVHVVASWSCAGREYVPRKGRFVLASNHLNNTDPAVVSAGLGRTRRIRFMAKVELFTNGFGWVMASWGAFPVRRNESDLGAMLTAERVLRQEMPLGMFPEGTRSRTGRMSDRLQPGTASIALRAGAPILPCAITGTNRLKGVKVFFTRPKVTLRFGPTIPVEQVKRPTPEQVSELTAQIGAAIRALLPPSHGGTYTG